MKNRFFLSIAVVLGLLSGGTSVTPAFAQQTQAAEPQTVPLDPAQEKRLKGIMLPLIQKMNHPLNPDEIKITVLADPHINAANAGGGNFFVTQGLLQKANDEELRGVLAHEIGHADLGHVAQQQVLGLGLELGAALLEKVLPGSQEYSPIAGQLVSNAYSRKDEYEADAQGVTLMRRAGYDGKTVMANTLGWIADSEGIDNGGGFFATHPATGDRVQRVQQMP